MFSRNPATWLRRVEVFHTELTAARAVVYARLDGQVLGEGFTLGGSVYGPVSKLTQVLSARHRLTDMGPGATLLARAVIPDPCLWSPETPVLYRVQVELRHSGNVVATEERLLALRGLVASGRNLIRDGKRWVLRAVTSSTTEPKDWPAWRASGAGLFTHEPPTGEVLQAAADHGVFVATCIEGRFTELVDELRALAQQPAVGVVLSPVYPDSDLRQVAPNILLGHFLTPSARRQPWVEIVAASTEDPAQIAISASDSEKPTFCLRLAGTPLELSDARAACDALQRDLAPLGQFAGYVV